MIALSLFITAVLALACWLVWLNVRLIDSYDIEESHNARDGGQRN